MIASSTPSPESATRDRYAAAAHASEAALCCPVDYDPQYLKAIPAEVIEKDYGCGDPSKHLHPGETVLDLGSGTGKICFIASQVVGPTGKVIGVDMTDDMLEVARRNAPVVAEAIGHANVEFRKGRIQDLALDLDILGRELAKNPISNANAYLAADALAADLRVKHPLIATDSIDVVVSNCVLNLVETHLKRQLFDEIFRVLKKGGRAVISDIVSDEEIPLHLQNDPHLWSGCISGAYTEEGFLKAFEEAGFYGIEILKRDTDPWQTVEGIEFRSVTIQAWKGKQGPCFERNQAVIYKGPFKKILDDDGHALERGKRYAVCAKTFMSANQTLKQLAPDLATSFPRSPRETLAGYVVAARTLDKCRAVLAGTSGEYHFDCPLDRTFFDFAGLDSDAFRDFVATGASDTEVAEWITSNSCIKDETERVLWNNKMRHTRPCDMAPELQVFLEGYIPQFIRTDRPVYVWFDIYDIEEQRL